MRSNLFSLLKTLFFFGIGVLLIWLVVRDLSEEQKQQIFISFREADYVWFFLAIGLGILSNISRAFRWKMLLAPLGYNPKLFNTFSAVVIGYMANLAIPRLGEVSRCGVLTKYDNIPFARSFGTVITERIIDMLMLMILFFITVAVEYEKIYGYASEKIIDPFKTRLYGGHTLLYALIFLVLSILFLIWLSKKRTDTPSAVSKFFTLLKGFWEGIKSIRNVNNPLLFIFHSIFIWLMYYLTTYFCLYCFTTTSSLGTAAALALLVFGSLAVIATPGGIGAYQIIAVEILSLYGVSLPVGYAYGWIGWLSQVVQVLAAALVCLILLPIKNQEVANPQIRA